MSILAFLSSGLTSLISTSFHNFLEKLANSELNKSIDKARLAEYAIDIMIKEKNIKQLEKGMWKVFKDIIDKHKAKFI